MMGLELEETATIYKDVRPKTLLTRSVELKDKYDFEQTTKCDVDTVDDDLTLVIPDPDAKILSPRQEVFPKPHVDMCPQELTYNTTFWIKNKHNSCCWRSDVDNKIFIGGENIITALRVDGRQQVYKLWDDNMSVISGLAVTSEKQLTCISQRNYQKGIFRDKYGIYTVNINEDIPKNTPLHPVNTLYVTDRPVCMFNIDKLRYGVLCLGGTIQFFSLKNILLDRDSKSLHVMRFGIEISPNDSACATPDGNVCVASHEKSTIHIYTTDCELLHAYTSESEMRTLGDAWYWLFKEEHRIFVQCCGDGIIIVNSNGVICTLNNGELTRLEIPTHTDRQRLKRIHLCVSSEDTMWFMEGHGRNRVHVYNTSGSTQPRSASWSDSIPDVDQQHAEGEVFLRPPTDPCPGGLVYNKTITTQHKHKCCWRSGNDDTIFLGGKNIITILREDESEKTVNIKGDKQFSRSNRAIISGLAVTANKHLICVEATHPAARYAGKRYFYRVDIPSDHPNGAHVQAERPFYVKNPICVFMADKLQYGVLCGMERTSEVIFFSWSHVFSNFRKYYTANRMSRIHIDKECSINDTVCAASDGNICISFIKLGSVCMYDTKGNLLEEFDLVNIGVEVQHRFSKNRASFVQGCKNGILVVNAEGVVFTLIDGRWQILNNTEITRLGQVRHCVYNGNRMWVIDSNKKRIVRIYT